MSRLWKQVCRIAKHTHNIMLGMFKRGTKRTTSTFSAVGETIGNTMTGLVVLAIMAVIIIVAVPVGAFELEREVPAKAKCSSHNKEVGPVVEPPTTEEQQGEETTVPHQQENQESNEKDI